jgi:hypothetical protein
MNPSVATRIRPLSQRGISQGELLAGLTWPHYFLRPMRLLRACGPKILDRDGCSATIIPTPADTP